MNDFIEKDANGMLQALLTLREEMRQLLIDSSEGAQPVMLDAPIGRLSRMDALQQQSMVRASRVVAQRRLALVESALRRHAEGTYGLCQRCEEEIGRARLKASPEAALCIACQHKSESRDHR